MGKEIDFKLDNVSMEVLEYDHCIFLVSVVVKEKERNEGLGTKALLKVIAYAEKQKKPLLLFATNELGGDVSRLKEWYKRHGFYEEYNKLNIPYNYNLRRDSETI